MNASVRTNRKRGRNLKGWRACVVGAAGATTMLVSTACAASEPEGTGSAHSDRMNAADPAKPGSTEDASVVEPVAKAAVVAFSNRVANFNVHNPSRVGHYDRHLTRIVNEIARYRPQVIALEEICVQETKNIVKKLEKKGYHYYVAHGSVQTDSWACLGAGSAYGNAILSAAPLTGIVNKRYSEGGSEERGYVSAHTTVAGKKARVFATHLAQSGQRDARKKQISELLSAAKKYRNAIVLGDFNADPAYSEMKPMWNQFRDADPSCGPTRNRPPCQATADASPYRKKFDYIFLRKNGRYSAPSLGVHPTYSDHDLVHADLRVR
ncbi:endonuclease/exonuclease/phosphatase family protein [Streptomyces abyssomicinicus]|uniref:endonuclease/exonuclease/phosphatase family protein n=1 Tax=Streptomyces abyssomicinicus TaxID=574929 RepID=UPI001FE55B11|nr:endonuclease/exonuclease/phosphatase family protein [Streptomyces abyssomicinicus]